jgi:hypothetical protein
VHIYKLSQMDATSLSLVHADVTDPRHSIFLPLCKILPSGYLNTVLLEGHHLDGSITFKFANARDQSQFISIAQKSSEIYSMVNDAYQDVRFLSAGGQVQECESSSAVNSCGVGILIGYSKNGRSLTVRDIVQGSPASACGLIDVHDHLLKVDNVSAKHSFSTLEDVVDSIRGIEGTKVTLQFRKSCGPAAKSTYEVTLRRAPNDVQQSCSIPIGETKLFQHKQDESSVEDTMSNPSFSQEDDVNLQNEKMDSFNSLYSQDHLMNLESGKESPKKHVVRNIQSAAIVPQLELSHQPYSTHRKPDLKYSVNLVNQNSPQEFSLDVNFRPLPQDVSKISDTKEKLSRYLQAIKALSSAAVGSGSTHVFQRPTLQNFATDLGIMLSPTRDHRFEVRSIVSNTPASKRNVNVGDLLLAIDREPVALKSQEEVCELLARPSMLFRVFFFFLIASLHSLCSLHRN